MRILRSLAIAFAMYSRIPMPRVAWNSENMRYAACFLPFVGVLIGGLEVLLFWGGALFGLSPLVRALFAAALPILVTGGMHLDGFMDTKDALNSYKPREEKLRILKDSRVGAFAVIRLALYLLIFLAAAAQIAALPYGAALPVRSASLSLPSALQYGAARAAGESAPAFGFLQKALGSPEGILVCAAAGFVLSRILAAAFLTFAKKSKNEGFAYMFAEAADRRAVGAGLIAESALILVPMGILSPLTAVLELLLMGLYTLRFLKMADREFGGISGDLLGMAITELELAALLAAAATAILM